MIRHLSGSIQVTSVLLVLAAVAFFSRSSPLMAVTISDDFSAVADFSGGDVSGVWSGSYNMPNLAGGLFGSNFFATEELTIDDNGVTNVGWEGGRSTAPFLFADVPAGQDFTATVKISGQTSGFWSAAGLIARAGNSPTPPGTGADHADENFVTMTSFRTDSADPDSGNTLMKRIEAGAQLNDLNIDINPGTIPNPTPPPDDIPNPEPLPIWLRLERVGGVGYRGFVSTNGVDFQLQSHTIPSVGNALRDAAVPLEVGVSYMNFGTLSGTATLDDFVLDTQDPLPAPGAPVITAAQTAFTVQPGDVIQEVITDSTMQTVLSWVRTPNLPGTDDVFPSGLGPNAPVLDPLVEMAPDNGTVFYWNTASTMPGETHMITVTATNSWGQVSNELVLTVNVVPEPAGVLLAAVALIGLGLLRRRS